MCYFAYRNINKMNRVILKSGAHNNLCVFIHLHFIIVILYWLTVLHINRQRERTGGGRGEKAGKFVWKGG